MRIRNEIEKVIKDNHIDRSNCFECSNITYDSIIKKIEQTFVLNGGNIHRSNMGSFNKKLACSTIDISENRMWVAKLPDIIPENDNPVYVLFEDSVNYKPKYWIYEMRIPELICIIGEAYGINDFYIVSKKFNWLISECHEDVVSFVGDSLCLSYFDKYHG